MSECAIPARGDASSAEREARRMSKAIQVDSLPSDQAASVKISNPECHVHLDAGDNEMLGRKNRTTAVFVILAIAAALLFGLIFTLFSFNFNFFEVKFNELIVQRMCLLGSCSSHIVLFPKLTTKTWLLHKLAESATKRISSQLHCGSKSHRSATKSRS
jgi:hypothetical protein